MGGSSRHKSHRSHKHRDRSESEDEGDSRDRKKRSEEDESARVSRVSDQVRRKGSSGNGDLAEDRSRQRKDRGEDLGVGGDDDGDGARVDRELEKSLKMKSLGLDLKGKYSGSRRGESSSEKNKERMCGGNKHKDEKGKESERESEKDKKLKGSRHERSNDGASRREEPDSKQGVEINELQEVTHNPDLDKEHDDRRRKRRKDGSRELDRIDEERVGDVRQISSRDDCLESRSYKDSRYKEKYKEELARDRRRRDDKCRDERSSRTHTSERSDSKYYRDENGLSGGHDKKTKFQDSDHNGSRHDDKCRDERSSRTHTSEKSDSKYRRDENGLSGGHDKKTRFQDSDHDGSRHDDKCRDERSSRTRTSERSGSKHYRDENGFSGGHDKKTKFQDSDYDGSRHADNYSTKLKENRGRKRSCDEIEDQNDMKHRSQTEPCVDTAKNGSSFSNRCKQEDRQVDIVDPRPGNNRTKNYPNSSPYATEDQNRQISRPAELAHRGLPSEDAHCSGTVNRDHSIASGGQDRISNSQTLEKAKSNNNIDSDSVSVPHHDRMPRSDTHTSPIQLTEKFPSSACQCPPERITVQHSLDLEREYLAEKPREDNFLHVEHKKVRVPVAPSFSKQTMLQHNSPGRLLGSYGDERVQIRDCKTNNPYKRCGDANGGRGQGTPWRSSPSPIANGFMPLQHGPPAVFPPVLQQYPTPSQLGIRPSTNLNSTYHIHEAGNRFPGHARASGWLNPVHDCPPHLQVWDQNRHSMNSRGREMSTDMPMGQNGNVNTEIPLFQEENGYSHQAAADQAWGQAGHHSYDEVASLEQHVVFSGEINLPSDLSPAQQTVGADLKSRPNVNGTSKSQFDNTVRFYCTYLSKLDISLELAKPELYKQCMSLVQTRDGSVASNVSKLGQLKTDAIGSRLEAKSKDALNTLFPPASDAIFQRAMALYWKQKEGTKKASFAESTNQMEKKPLPADAVTANYMDKDANTAANAEGEHNCDPEEKEQSGNTSDAGEKGCDMNLDADVFVEGSDKSESIMPESTVNLCQIHLSESTH